MSEGFIPPHGGYENLLSYKKAKIVYLGTVHFCQRFLDKYDRNIGQMVQAARSGKQNIVEGCQVSGTSKEGEVKLIGVARGSLEELLEDFRDYLAVNEQPVWDKNSQEARFIRKLGANPEATYETFKPFIETRPAPVVANILICLIHQANYLLDQQKRQLQGDFLNEGGLRERMTRARLKERNKQKDDPK